MPLMKYLYNEKGEQCLCQEDQVQHMLNIGYTLEAPAAKELEGTQEGGEGEEQEE